MIKFIQRQSLMASAAFMVGFMGTTSKAHAGNIADQDFSSIFDNIVASFEDFPAIISMFAYVGGLILALLGVLKIKDHVEDPKSADLKEGAIRLAAGGALFALPLIMEAMTATIGEESQEIGSPLLNAIDFGSQ